MRPGWKVCLRASIATLAVLANASVAHAANPVISEISPNVAPSTESARITIEGENFLPEGSECSSCTMVEVFFDGQSVPVISGKPEKLEVATPLHEPGGSLVTVESAGLTSEPFPFTFQAPAPRVTITSPAPNSATGSNDPLVTGEAGTQKWDEANVTVTLYEGASLGTPLEMHTLDLSAGGQWSTAFGPWGPGTYTVRASQQGKGGSVGWSQPVTFKIVADPPAGGGAPGHPPPSASFAWFPSSPRTGEVVSLVSSSRDTLSPITGFAWALGSTVPFVPGGPFYSTTFTTPGAHVVRLRVTSADGLASTATSTIVVGSPAASLMAPFPVVRIAGHDTGDGVRLSLLTVLAPSGAVVSVRCRGHGCPVRRARKVAHSARSGVVLVRFRKFATDLPAGVKLIVRVSKAGEIGKYTSFLIRSGKLPKRTDACLEPGRGKAIACPS